MRQDGLEERDGLLVPAMGMQCSARIQCHICIHSRFPKSRKGCP